MTTSPARSAVALKAPPYRQTINGTTYNPVASAVHPLPTDVEATGIEPVTPSLQSLCSAI
jgi:hypothetical protein